MSTILLTGRNGFIGQELIPLLKRNHKVVSVIRSQKDRIDYRSEELIVNDICNIKLTEVKKYKVDLIIHLAAQVRGRPSDKLKNNIESTQRISSIASSLDVPIIFLSSTNVFFDAVLGNYTKSKIICEEILKNNNPMCCIIRVPLVVGLKSSSMETIRGFYKRYSFFPLFGKQDGKTQPIHVSSLIEYILKLVKVSKYDCKEINIIGRIVYTYRNIIRNILGLSNNNRLIIIPLPFIYLIARVCEFIHAPFFITCEELISVNKDKVIDVNKNINTVIVDNNENILFN